MQKNHGSQSEGRHHPTAQRTSELKDSGNPPCKGVFDHTSRLKIVFSFVCLGRTLLFEFILATQFFVHQIIYANFPFLFYIIRYHSISVVISSRPLVPRPLSSFHPPTLSPASCYSSPFGIIAGFTVLGEA